MAEKIRRRTEIPCKDCGRGRHRTCSACGQTKLIGYAGKSGLYDHITQQLHTCNAEAPWEVEGSGSDSNQSDENIKGADTGGSGGGGNTQQDPESDDSNSGGQGDSDDNPFEGKNVVVTGTLKNMSRAQAVVAINTKGGRVQSYVNSSTDFIVVADSAKNTGKQQAAERLGVDTMSEEEFEAALNGKQQQSQQSQQGNNGEGSNDEEQVSNEDLLTRVVEALKTKREDLLGFNPDQLEKKLEDLAQEAIETAKANQTLVIEVKSTAVGDDGEEVEQTTTINGAHEQMPTLLKIMSARKNIMIVGPAGSGKTRGVEEAAKALGLSFHPKSVGPATTEYALFGYMDANGNYIPGIMRTPFESGGVLLIDEIDAGNPACITALNTALANDYCSFPDGVIKKHPDFVAVASANTFGRGADRQYVGRNQMDAATLDRFIKLPWDYDRKLEQNIITAMINSSGENKLQDWLKKVWSIRDAVDATKERFVVGTRAVIDGADLILAGFTLAQTETLRIWNGTDDEMRNRLLARMK